MTTWADPKPFLERGRRLWIRFRLNEAGPLLSLSAVSLFAWAFVKIADEVIEGDTRTLDRAVLLALRSSQNPADPLGPSWLEEAARDVTALGGNVVLTFVTLATIVYLLMTRKGSAALLVAAAVGGGMLLSTVLKIGFERPRPDLVPHAARVYTASFPSGHAMLSAVTYLTLGALLARFQPSRRLKAFFLAVAVILTLAIGASRVYLGVHWPTDVLAGWCIGAAWAAFCWFLALQLQVHGQVERADESDPARVERG
jgi:undecaprenyl-diphosphatase